LQTRRDSPGSWVTRVDGRLEADGFQTRLVGRVGTPASAKVVAAAWTVVMLFFLVIGTVIGVADRSIAHLAEGVGCSLLGLSIFHGYVVAGGRTRPGEIDYLKAWLVDRLV
jgi:hypothetical protein